MAPTEERSGNWGYRVFANMAESMQDEMQQKPRISLRIFRIARASGSKTKGARENGTSTTWKRTLRTFKLLFSADCCVVKAKCYRSMRKTEAPHSLRIVFDSGEVGTQSATQCFM